MHRRILPANHSRWALMIAILLLAYSTVLISASEDTAAGKQEPYWQKSLPSSSCPGSTEGTYCHRASPVLADITGDGNLEIIVATNRGHVLAYAHDGKLIWDKDVAGAFGMANNTQRITSSPAVADIDADGKMEVVVGTGTTYRQLCTQGGVIVLEDDGSVKSGWPFLTEDYSIPPSGCRDTVFSTPALGDLDEDGDLEIVFGAFDMRVYALQHNGTIMAGFPVQSNHFKRFGWENLRDRLADHIWSSPALADLDGDGFLDIILGTEEGNFDSSFPGEANGWTCPYQEVSFDGYCGGSIYAIDRFGKILPGFPKYKLESTMSTPAAFDIDGNGRSEFFVGTGEYYLLFSPDHPRYGERLYGVGGDGRDLPGWEGGKKMGGVVTASPVLGDIDGDDQPEVVVAARDNKLYAFELNGNTVPGFPMTPKMEDGRVLNSYRTGSSAVLGDYTGDGKMEIFLNHASQTIIIDGQGKHVTSSFKGDSAPSYVTDGPYRNTPAVGDLDGDGHLELVTQHSKLTVWKLSDSTQRSDWPMFKQNAGRSSAIGPELYVDPSTINAVHGQGELVYYQRPILVNAYFGVFDFTLRTDNPDIIKLPFLDGQIVGSELIPVSLRMPANMPLGTSDIGTIFLVASQNGKVHMTIEIPVSATIFRDVKRSYLPSVQ